MNEENRKEIIDIIQKGLIDKESLKSKREELIKLTKNPNVAKYIELLRDIERIEQDLKQYKETHVEHSGSCTFRQTVINDTLENRIKYCFRKEIRRFSCNHSVWIYDGSHGKIYYPSTRHFKAYKPCSPYNSDAKFLSNDYVCLECQETMNILAEDVEQFESSHTVLKRYEDETAAERYQDLYYNLLYQNYGFSDAQKLVIDEFNKDSEKRLSKLKHN